MSLRLKNVMRDRGIRQVVLARHLNMSETMVSLLINKRLWPASRPQEELKAQICQFVGASAHDLFEETDALVAQGAAPTRSTPANHNQEEEKETDMLLKKHVLTPEARRAFGVTRDPFAEPRSAEEVYLTSDARYVRESLRSIARHGGFAAVVGESGAGKSTLRRDLIEWAKREAQEVVIIEPYVLGMEADDKKGKTLKAAQIAEAIMHAVLPGQKLRQSSEARFRQAHDALTESSRAGNRHVLLIEEAHGLPIPTLKHLKRFYELEDGFQKLLSVVLIGQTELADRLDERNPSVREIVQRCQLITLRPLDNELDGYLKHRFKIAGLKETLLPEAVIEALRSKLTGRDGRYSLLYPLAVHNVVTCAMNEAARLGIPGLTPDLIKGV